MESKKDGILPLGILKQASMKLDSFMSDIQEVKEDEDITPEQKLMFEQMIEMSGNMLAAIINAVNSEIEEADFIAETLDMDPIEEYLEAPEVDIMDMEIPELESYSDDSDDETFFEMAMIACEPKLNISVNQEIKKLSIAYFKVYNHEKYSAATRVARLHFKDSGMEYHDDSRGKDVWEINKSDSRKIVELMQAPSDDHDGYTNWQVACYQWNHHNGLVKSFKDYFAGKYDHMYDDDSRLKKAYVPHDQEMPDAWVYDHSKGRQEWNMRMKYEDWYVEGIRRHMEDVGILKEEGTYDPYDYRGLLEMASRLTRDVSGKCNMIIAVGTSYCEDPVPHFHVFRDESDVLQWKGGACLMFMQNCYYDHNRNAGTLTKGELAAVAEYLKRPNRWCKDITNWQWLIGLWNNENDGDEIPIETEMPDYDFDTITRYREMINGTKKE